MSSVSKEQIESVLGGVRDANLDMDLAGAGWFAPSFWPNGQNPVD